MRVLKSKKYKKTDVDDQAAEMQDRLERTLGCECRYLPCLMYR